MQKRMNWENLAYCHLQRPQATERVMSALQLFNCVLPEWERHKVSESPETLPQLQGVHKPPAFRIKITCLHWQGGKWIFPLPALLTLSPCSDRHTYLRREAKISNLLRNQPWPQSTWESLDSGERMNRDYQQSPPTPSLPNQRHKLGN